MCIRDSASTDTVAAEQRAADRIFGLLPPDQAAAFRALWDEFEAAETPDAVFAKSLDRVEPVSYTHLDVIKGQTGTSAGTAGQGFIWLLITSDSRVWCRKT